MPCWSSPLFLLDRNKNRTFSDRFRKRPQAQNLILTRLDMICKTVFEPCSGPHFQLACYVCKTSPVIGVIHPHAHTSIRELLLPVLPVKPPIRYISGRVLFYRLAQVPTS
jgi:hypothetical protein